VNVACSKKVSGQLRVSFKFSVILELLKEFSLVPVPV
jgi:hypothetical protein